MNTKSKLYLVGTVHTDLNGPKRLEGFLEGVKPAAISIEDNADRIKLCQKYRSNFDENFYDELFKRAGVVLDEQQRRTLFQTQMLVSQIYGYETFVSVRYAERNPSVKLELTDIAVFNHDREVREYLGLLCDEDVEDLKNPVYRQVLIERLQEGIESYINFMKWNTQLEYDALEFWEFFIKSMRIPGSFEELSSKYNINQLRMLKFFLGNEREDKIMGNIRRICSEVDGKIVCINGLAHLFGMRDRLKDLKPRILTLDKVLKSDFD